MRMHEPTLKWLSNLGRPSSLEWWSHGKNRADQGHGTLVSGQPRWALSPGAVEVRRRARDRR